MLLSEQELRSALEPLLDRLLIERLRYFQLQLEPRLQALIDSGLNKAAGQGANEALERVLAADEPNQTFEDLYEAARGLVGEARALLVTYGGEIAVWRSEAVRLPARFPAASQSAILKPRPGSRAEAQPIRVRDAVVGWLYWEAAAEIEAAARGRVQQLLHVTGLVLLEQGLRAAEATPAPASLGVPAVTGAGEIERAPASLPTPRAPRTASEAQAQRFADLLIEDLRLYLEHERRQELAEARRNGAVAARFEAELERSRRAFLERFPPGIIDGEIFEEAGRRL